MVPLATSILKSQQKHPGGLETVVTKQLVFALGAEARLFLEICTSVFLPPRVIHPKYSLRMWRAIRAWLKQIPRERMKCEPGWNLSSGHGALYGPEQRGCNIPADWEPVLFLRPSCYFAKSDQKQSFWQIPNFLDIFHMQLRRPSWQFPEENQRKNFTPLFHKMFKVCTEAVHCVALWTQTLSQVWAKQRIA